MGISYGDNTYTFAKNIRGDVIGIYSGGTLVAKYEYNAYGQILSITNASGADISNNASHIANINPFRYRGYYYDTETGFYYVSSRYYDPEIGRWVNADSVNILANQFVGGYNSFSFSLNNFVNTPNVMSAKRSAFVQGEYSPTEPDIAIIYNVPLYDQNGYNLCWAFCQVMVDDFVAGISRTNEEATQSAIALAMERHRVTDINDVDAWNKGSRPLNLGKNVEINSIEDLYSALSKGYPLYVSYAAYRDGERYGHAIIVTGVNLTKGLIYTNNPWGINGYQTYEEFLSGFLGDEKSEYKFEKCFYFRY